jgi:monothiol glutaredoxin
MSLSLLIRRAAPSLNTISRNAAVASQTFQCTTSTRSFLTRSTPLNAEEPGSHDDFAPKLKAAAPGNKVHALIEQHIKENKVMLYMKGSPSQPQCGFSGKMVGILNDHAVDFSSVNVLEYPQIREGIKTFGGWPTIPQLYVGGEFVGGCDIVTEMNEDGELKDLFESVKAERT